MKILLMGYYGQKNLGDDLFVKQLTNYFDQRSDVGQVDVICKANYYPKTSEKINFWSSQQLSKLKRLGLIVKADKIFWGGGTLNIDSKPTNLLRMQSIAQLMGKQFGFLGIGLEGIKSEVQDASYELFKKANLLYCRDSSSYELAKKLNKDHENVGLGGDLAFLDLSIYHPFLSRFRNSEIKEISFSGMFWWGDGRAQFYGRQLMPLIEKYNTVIHLLPCHVGQENNDNRFHELLRKYIPEKNCLVHSWSKTEEVLEVLGKMDFHFGNRLHSIIMADILGIPNIGIGEKKSKIGNYIEKTGVLYEERRVAFMEEISLGRIEKIFREYKRPEDFINNESEQAQKCLEQIR
ncbi:polysaccharide pyruvyl transferase family protein [Spirulina subsalsa FACHB-351]|uniref:Polysaccharide pyruvyl transferase family protein n=1 Tax=Spirulina subsalsa FACHB-351 TaxID=234711 RepID=A0ABT3L1T6_9CYAN|nr:polysaccharide pyruvyl transferase family protein [Spirulina subsalsa]MCW6035458.1 polysaccharide pyruvyl transferase family protein [Spirulina subsalsa FACHB-351]